MESISIDRNFACIRKLAELFHSYSVAVSLNGNLCYLVNNRAKTVITTPLVYEGNGEKKYNLKTYQMPLFVEHRVIQLQIISSLFSHNSHLFLGPHQ